MSFENFEQNRDNEQVAHHNDTSGTVHGPNLQVREVNGNVHIHHQEPAMDGQAQPRNSDNGNDAGARPSHKARRRALWAAVAAGVISASVVLTLKAWGFESDNDPKDDKADSTSSVSDGDPSKEPKESLHESSSASESATASEISLLGIDSVSGGYEAGRQKVNGTSEGRALSVDLGSTLSYCDSEGIYQLDRKYERFRAKVGLADSSPSEITTTFTVKADNEPKQSQTVAVGETQSFDLDVTGAFRITLAAESSDCTGIAVWIDPVVTP